MDQECSQIVNEYYESPLEEEEDQVSVPYPSNDLDSEEVSKEFPCHKPQDPSYIEDKDIHGNDFGFEF